LLNLFLMALIGGHLLRHGGHEVATASPSLPRILANAQASLSAPDAAAFGAVMRRDAPRYVESARKLVEARTHLERQITAQPYDAAATKQAFRQSVDPHLYGLGDIHSSITGGAFLAYRFEPFEIAATARQAITHRGNGLNGFVRFEYHLQLIPHQWDFRIGTHLDFANSEYEQTRFGVSPIQSEQSGLPVFTPQGGLKDVGLRASLTYISTEHLILRAFADVNRFTGDRPTVPSS
jgi:hypothetical protein